MRLTPLFAFGCAVLCATSSLAQNVGDTAAEVRAALGAPPMTRQKGERTTWVYPGGIKVGLEHGVVVEVNKGDPYAPAAAPVASPAASNSTDSGTAANAPAFSENSTTSASVASPAIVSERRKSAFSARGLVLLIAAGLLQIVCWIFILIEAFREGAVWGLAALLLPFAGLVFVITHWQRTKTPFLLSLLLGVPLSLIARLI